MSTSFGMIDVFTQVGKWIQQLISAINSAVPLYFGTVRVPLVNLLFIFIILSMIITIFWKGAQG